MSDNNSVKKDIRWQKNAYDKIQEHAKKNGYSFAKSANMLVTDRVKLEIGLEEEYQFMYEDIHEVFGVGLSDKEFLRTIIKRGITELYREIREKKK